MKKILWVILFVSGTANALDPGDYGYGYRYHGNRLNLGKIETCWSKVAFHWNNKIQTSITLDNHYEKPIDVSTNNFAHGCHSNNSHL